MEEAISEKELDIQTKILAKRISDKHRGDATPIVMVCILNGGFMFFSDLVKQITAPIEIDFIRCKSYFGKKQGDLVITKDLETKIKGKHVYLIDDILDSGNTMIAVKKFLQVKEPKSITPVVTIYKENVDFDEVFHIIYHRNLKTIYIV